MLIVLKGDSSTVTFADASIRIQWLFERVGFHNSRLSIIADWRGKLAKIDKLFQPTLSLNFCLLEELPNSQDSQLAMFGFCFARFVLENYRGSSGERR